MNKASTLMGKVTGCLPSILGMFLYIFFFYGEIAGIMHSAKKHSTGDVIAAISIPPWAWYRSIEMFWHNDFADVDWDKRLKSDIESSVYLLSQAGAKDADVYKINEDIEKFSNKISKYPKDKRQFLINGSRKYISFSNLMVDDMGLVIIKYYKTGKANLALSAKTMSAEQELINKYNLKDFMEPLQKGLSEIVKKMNEDTLANYSDEEIEDLIVKKQEQLNVSKEQVEMDFKRTFKRLFAEEL
jgi:hypothetical protein